MVHISTKQKPSTKPQSQSPNFFVHQMMDVVGTESRDEPGTKENANKNGRTDNWAMNWRPNLFAFRQQLGSEDGVAMAQTDMESEGFRRPRLHHFASCLSCQSRIEKERKKERHVGSTRR